MIPSLIQKAALLLLSGAGFYWAFFWGRTGSFRGEQKTLVIAVFAVTCALVMLIPIRLPNGAVVDARAGPVLLAAFVTGPLGGLVTAIVGGFVRSLYSGVFAVSGVLVFFVYAAAGTALGAWWKMTLQSRVTAVHALLLTVISILCAASMYFLIPGAVADDWLNNSLPFIAIANTLSVLLICMAYEWGRSTSARAIEAEEIGERLDIAVNSAGMGIYEIDLKSDTPVWNRQMFEIYGIDPEGPVHGFNAWLEMVVEEDRDQQTASYSRFLQDGQIHGSEFRIRRKNDGALRHIRGDAILLRGTDGTPERIIATNIDVTDLRTSEAREVAVQTRLADVIENIPGVVFQYLLRPDGTDAIESVSSGAHDIWGISPEEVEANPSRVWGIIHEDDVPGMQSSIAASVQEMSPWYHSWRVTLPNGEEKTLEGRGTPSLEDDGSVRFQSIVVDVTEQVRMREDLADANERVQQSQKLESIGKLTGGIAHDFNNLLAIIVGNLELLRDEPEAEEAAEYVDASLNAAMRGADLVRNMLSFARRARLSPTAFALNDMISKSQGWMSRVLPATIDVHVKLDEALPRIEADVSSTESALLNLILNARDAMPEGGALTIETSRIKLEAGEAGDVPPGAYVMLAVSDTGIGIPAENLQRVFEPFFTTKSPGLDSGSGLGLSMVHGFMRQSGGSARVYSEIGVGTTIKLFFPVYPEPASPRMPEPEPKVRSKPRDGTRILLAEDEAAVAEVLVRALGRAGYEVVAAETGDAAAEIFRDDRSFDALVTDVVMPGTLQGPDLARHLRELEPSLPVVFMSGYAREATVFGNGLRSEDIRLMKPVPSADLVAAIERAIALSKRVQTV